MTEIRTTSSTGAEKGVKPERYDLIPVDALAAVARLYGAGAKKYAEHNWRAGYEFSKSYAALQRHANQFWNGEDVDPEMGESHLAAVIFHAMTLLTFQQEHPEFDDRYSSKSVSSDRSGLLDILKPKATSDDIFEFNKKTFEEVLLNAPQKHQVLSSEGCTITLIDILDLAVVLTNNTESAAVEAIDYIRGAIKRLPRMGRKFCRIQLCSGVGSVDLVLFIKRALEALTEEEKSKVMFATTRFEEGIKL